jgi:UDP-glucose 4-epimerase
VIHAAGLAHQFRAGQHDRPAFLASNAEATANVVQAAIAAGVAHVVLVSSVAVYGGSAADEDAPCRPEGPYAESKYLAERRAIELAERHGLRLTILRLATIYGEQDPGNVARLMRTIDRGRFIWVGTGANRKSLIYRDDAARACVAAAQAQGSGIGVYNVSAPPEPMRAVVENLAAALGRRVPRWHIPAGLVLSGAWAAARVSGGRGLPGRLSRTAQKWLADDIYPAQRFGQRFQFQTQTSLPEGLRREAAWYRRQTQ